MAGFVLLGLDTDQGEKEIVCERDLGRKRVGLVKLL